MTPSNFCNEKNYYKQSQKTNAKWGKYVKYATDKGLIYKEHLEHWEEDQQP